MLNEIINKVDRFIKGQPENNKQPNPSMSNRRARLHKTGLDRWHPGRIIARSASMPYWQMHGWKEVPSNSPGMRKWHGPLTTHFGEVTAEVESPHRGSYRLFVLDLPSHLQDHRCFARSAHRWEMHLHGTSINLDQYIYAAERELESHWHNN